MPRYVHATIGAIAGAIVGYFVFAGLLKLGIYAMVLPGALVGLCSGMLLRGESLAMGIACAASALGLSLFCEWHFFPFADNNSLGFFLANVHQLKFATLALMALGVGLAFYFGRGR